MNRFSALVLLLVATSPTLAQTRFAASLDGGQEVPPVTTSALGHGTVVLDAAETQITVALYFNGLGSNQTLGHIHGPAEPGVKGPVLFDIGSQGGSSGAFEDLNFAITPSQVADLKAGRFYFNVHSANNPGGEIRGRVLPDLPHYAVLAPIFEVPPVLDSAATGVGRVDVNAAGDQITVQMYFDGLGSNQTLAHIHGPAQPGANGPVIFDLGSQGATSGTYTDVTFPATPDQITLLRAGSLYFNVHSVTFPGGEIRGQIFRGWPIAAGLTGDQEVPPVTTSASGYGLVALNASETGLRASVAFTGLGSNATLGHIHGPALPGANGPVVFDLGTAPTLLGGTTGFAAHLPFAATQAQIADLKTGRTYFNIHSVDNGGGEIRGQVDVLFVSSYDLPRTPIPQVPLMP